MVCDLSTFDSIAQRFGRVNRFGDRDDTRIDVVHPKEFDEEEDFDLRLKRTLDLLMQLNGNGSPAALGKLDPDARVAAFAPPPVILPVTDILFDAWVSTVPI
jgi:CRISPR-associated endonuclease/helicase Cas3